MSPRNGTTAPAETPQERDPAEVLWVAHADLYPTIEGTPGSLPVPAYRSGQRVPYSEVERHGWHGLVHDSEQPPEPDSTRAELTVHPVIAGLVQAQQEADEGIPDERDAGPPKNDSPPPGGTDSTDTEEGAGS